MTPTCEHILGRLVLATIVLLALASGPRAEVREREFGAQAGYPVELGWPFRTIPQFRHGALTGRGLPLLEPFAPPFWLTSAGPVRPLERGEAGMLLRLGASSLMRRHPITAMLLIREGRVVFEEYQYGTSAATLFDGQSIAKSFTALAIGALFDDGRLGDVDAPLEQIVPGLRDSPVGKATLRQALQMQCGHDFKWADGGPDSSAGRYSGVKFARERSRELFEYFRTLPAVAPGSRFSYDPHCSDALSMVVSQATGKPLREYFQARIWERLGPEHRAAWLGPQRNPALTSGANGFFASARDYARLAMLFVDEGRVGDAQVVSSAWMRRMHTDTVPVGDYPSNFRRYGYQVWVREERAGSWFAALGNWGQRVLLDPASRSAMIVFALDQEHIPDTDRFWESVVR